MTLIDTVKTDATDAAWRTAGSQLVKLTRAPLVALLQRHLAPGDDAFRAKVASFLETEVGTAMLTGLLGVLIAAVPMPAATAPMANHLAKELRVRAMSSGMDTFADVLMGPLREVLTFYIQDVQTLTASVTPPTMPSSVNGHVHNDPHVHVHTKG